MFSSVSTIYDVIVFKWYRLIVMIIETTAIVRRHARVEITISLMQVRSNKQRGRESTERHTSIYREIGGGGVK